MGTRVFVAGVGMIPFTKPGASEPYPVMAAGATRAALKDGDVDYTKVQQAYVGYVYADSTAGQRALYDVGMTGIPIMNVNNNCSTGSTALFLARQAIASGVVDCALAVGFEQMNPGAIGTVFTDRPSPFDAFEAAANELVDAKEVPLALRYFGGAGLAHMKQYGTKLTTFAKVRAKAQAMTTDTPATFESRDMGSVVGYDMAKEAAHRVYAAAGITPEELDVVELHDCFAQNELITYEALGLCAEGDAEKFIEDGNNTYGGEFVTNPSGGLLSKGHPLGATGLAQCYELTHQLRRAAEQRQVENARLALQHNLGLGGACVVTLYERA